MKNKHPLNGMIAGFFICAIIVGFDAVAAKPESSVVPPDNVVTHRADGTLRSINYDTGWVSVDHGPIESMSWKAMTRMTFVVGDVSLLDGFKEGDDVLFVFFENKRSRYIIIELNHK